MQRIIEQYKNNGDIHHFHLIEGGHQETEDQLRNFLCNEFGVDPNDKALFFDYKYNQFKVVDSRALITQSQIKTPEDKKMVFLIFVNSINHHAQNALLKILEEPTARTYFFIVLPKIEGLLPTFFSRAVIIKKNLPKEKKNSFEEIQKMSITDRLKFVDNLVKDIKDEKKDRIEACCLIQNMIFSLRKKNEKSYQEEIASKIKILMQIEDFIGDSGSSIKILLERAVLLL